MRLAHAPLVERIARFRLQKREHRLEHELDRMEDVQLPAQAIRQELRGLDDHVIQSLGVTVHMGRVHAGDDAARLPDIRLFTKRSGRGQARIKCQSV
jgi:hypothetical protein